MERLTHTHDAADALRVDTEERASRFVNNGVGEIPRTRMSAQWSRISFCEKFRLAESRPKTLQRSVSTLVFPCNEFGNPRASEPNEFLELR